MSGEHKPLDLQRHFGIIFLFVLSTVILSCAYHSVSRDDKPSSVCEFESFVTRSIGYFRTSFRRRCRIGDTPESSSIPSKLWLGRGYLEQLPSRRGLPPAVPGSVPQRQSSRHSSFARSSSDAMSLEIKHFAASHSQHTYLGRSTFEGQDTTLFSRYQNYTKTRYLGEICRVKASDGSMLMTLHPADVNAVMEAGWGERYPLARSSLLWQILCLGPTSVPSGLTTIYAPRNGRELKVVGELVKAAAWWVGEIDSKIMTESYT